MSDQADQALLQKAMASLKDRGLELTGSVARIFLMLQFNGRVNVPVTHADGTHDVATLSTTPDGEVVCRLSNEAPYNVLNFRR